MSDSSEGADVEGRKLSPSEDEIVRAPQPAPKRRKHAAFPDGARSSKGKKGTERESFSVPRHKDDEDVDEDSFFIRARTSRQSQRLQALIDSRVRVSRAPDLAGLVPSEPKTKSGPPTKKRRREDSASKSGGQRTPAGNGYTVDGPDEVLSISSENTETDGDSSVKPTKKSTKPNRTLRSPSRTSSLTPPPVDPREYETISDSGPILVVKSPTVQDLFEPSTLPNISFHVPEPQLNPDLQFYAEQARRQAARQPTEPEKITIKLQPISDPRADTNLMFSQDHLKEFEKSMKFIVNSTDNFENVCKHFEERKGIFPGNIVLEYEGVEVFKSSTPASLGMKGRCTMQAYLKSTYEHVQHERALERLRRIEEIERQARMEEMGGVEEGSQPEQSVPAGSQDAAGGGLRIHLTSQDGVTVKLQVRKTTKILSIIKAYKGKRPDLPAATNVRIEFDGDILPLDGTLGNTDLEDGDVLHVLIG